MASPFSGTVSIFALKDNDYVATYFPGTTAGLQAAIDYLQGAKGKVWVGPGTLLTTSCVWLHSYCHIEGAGIGQTIIKRSVMANGDAADSGAVFASSAFGANGTLSTSSSPQYDISISELTVDGNQSGFGSVTQANIIPSGIQLANVDGVRIKQVRAQNTLGDGFRIKWCRNVELLEVETFTTGQWATSAARNAINFIGDGGGTGAWGYNYSLIGADLVTTGDEAIQVSNINLLTISDVNVDGCDFVIEVSPSTSSPTATFTDWSISNINAINVLSYFITFAPGDSNGYTIQDPGFYNCHFSGHATLHDGGCVAMPTASGYVVNGLTMINCTFRNINTADLVPRHWFDSQPADVAGVVGLTVVGCQFTGKSGSTRTGTDFGIHLRGSHSDIMFSDCIIKDMPGTAVRLNDTTAYAATVSRNIIFQNVLVDGCNDFAFRITAVAGSSTAAFSEIVFKGCTARNASKVTAGAAYQIFINQAGASVSNVDFMHCRAYKTSGTNLTYGFNGTQSAGTADGIEFGLCDFSGTATGWFLFSGTWTNVYFDDYPRVNSVASTATMALPIGDFIKVSGTADITSITPWFVWDRRPITLKFASTAATNGIVDGGNLKLASTMLYTADDTITLRYDQADAVWYEVARSVN